MFHLRNIFEKSAAVASREVSFKGNVYNFFANYRAIDKSDILKIHNYLVDKNNVK